MRRRVASRSVQDHPYLAPSQGQGDWFKSAALALAVHAILVIALAWGVSWKHDADPPVFAAELWSIQATQAAPQQISPPPRSSEATPTRDEPSAPPPPPRSTEPREADIVTEPPKRQKPTERKTSQQTSNNTQTPVKKATAQKQIPDRQTTDKKTSQTKAAETKVAEKKVNEKKTADQKPVPNKQAQENADAQASERQRQENLRRMLNQAAASGSEQATGTAQQSSGPSPGYGSRVAARIKPNVVFTDTANDNPRAEVEVRAQPDGTIVGRRLVKSSGNAAWDDAVLKAIDRTGTLPRDADGRVPPVLIVGLRPHD